MAIGQNVSSVSAFTHQQNERRKKQQVFRYACALLAGIAIGATATGYLLSKNFSREDTKVVDQSKLQVVKDFLSIKNFINKKNARFLLGARIVDYVYSRFKAQFVGAFSSRIQKTTKHLCSTLIQQLPNSSKFLPSYLTGNEETAEGHDMQYWMERLQKGDSTPVHQDQEIFIDETFIRHALTILEMEDCSSLMITGVPGTGKTEAMQHLIRIIAKKYPEKIIVELKTRNIFEPEFKNAYMDAIAAIKKQGKKLLLCIDEFTATTPEEKKSISSLFNKELAEGTCSFLLTSNGILTNPQDASSVVSGLARRITTIEYFPPEGKILVNILNAKFISKIPKDALEKAIHTAIDHYKEFDQRVRTTEITCGTKLKSPNSFSPHREIHLLNFALSLQQIDSTLKRDEPPKDLIQLIEESFHMIHQSHFKEMEEAATIANELEHFFEDSGSQGKTPVNTPVRNTSTPHLRRASFLQPKTN